MVAPCIPVKLLGLSVECPSFNNIQFMLCCICVELEVLDTGHGPKGIVEV